MPETTELPRFLTRQIGTLALLATGHLLRDGQHDVETWDLLQADLRHEFTRVVMEKRV